MKRALALLLGLALGVAAPPAYYPNGIGYAWLYSSGEEQVFSRDRKSVV